MAADAASSRTIANHRNDGFLHPFAVFRVRGVDVRALELWGGIECTVNRVGAQYFDQTRRTGHHDRETDLDLLAQYKFKRFRYPLLWERCCGARPHQYDWTWTDRRLAQCQALGLQPIAGLLHHGSGPAFTDLLDDAFPALFAAFSRAAAQRYAWIEDWTPINEPLTTARFSGLYGHWYPHCRDEASFWRMLLNQIEATRLAMKEIRRENPLARLIQTEDLGYTYATRAASAQAEHDNHRRWMTFDLLDGAVGDAHPLAERLRLFGLGDRLKALADDPSPADVIGVNHYLTSDRYLDHRLEDFPPEARGGNDYVSFADVEAVRVLQPAPAGLERALREAAARYRRPVAVTEAHNGCSRDEQMRWFAEAWRTALSLREEGLPIEAVTAWALFGSYDWDSLMTRARGRYESGAFDVRGPAPRPTALAALLTRIGEGGAAELPKGAVGEGWWRRDVRLQYRPVHLWDLAPDAPASSLFDPPTARTPLLICGGGALGGAFVRLCQWRNLPCKVIGGRHFLSGDVAAMQAAIERIGPWAVINAAGYVRVDEAENDAQSCYAANAHGAARLAAACCALGVPLASFSSDLVFDGDKTSPYLEADQPRGLNVYGRSKLSVEQAFANMAGPLLTVRTAAFFSPWEGGNFAAGIIRQIATGRAAFAPDTMTVSPTYLPDLAGAVLDLLIDGATGLWHLANAGALTWAQFGKAIVERLDFDPARVVACDGPTIGWTAPRPAYSALGTSRGQILPPLDDAIERYVTALRNQDFLSEFSEVPEKAGALLRAPSQV